MDDILESSSAQRIPNLLWAHDIVDAVLVEVAESSSAHLMGLVLNEVDREVERSWKLVMILSFAVLKVVDKVSKSAI